jgi:hypothetical protein
MTKCANCANDATFVYSISNVQNIYYCSKDAPRAVRNLLISLATNEGLEAEVAAVKAAKKSKTATVINSAPEEEAVDSNSNENEPTEEEVTENEPDN